MALPVKQKTWIQSPNNRIAFVSLIDTMQRYLFGIKVFLKANSYTVKGSASAGTGAMDAVDRWTLITDITPRATIAGASQAWIVLVDGNGTEILLAYQGGSDDIARISICSDGTGFSAAGTPNQQPTSSLGNEQVLCTGTTLIGATASVDRLWWGWVDNQHKMCRFAIARSGIWVGQLWGVELVTSSCVSPAVFTPSVWGFGFGAGGLNIVFSGNTAGAARIVVSSVSKLCVVRIGAEYFGIDTFADHIKTPLQGGTGYIMQGLSVATLTAGAEGKIGNLIDWWSMQGTPATGLPGDTLGTLNFVHMGTSGNGRGILWWPHDGATTPILT